MYWTCWKKRWHRKGMEFSLRYSAFMGEKSSKSLYSCNKNWGREKLENKNSKFCKITYYLVSFSRKNCSRMFQALKIIKTALEWDIHLNNVGCVKRLFYNRYLWLACIREVDHLIYFFISPLCSGVLSILFIYYT